MPKTLVAEIWSQRRTARTVFLVPSDEQPKRTQGEAGADSPLEDRVETETLETYIIKLFFCRHSSCNVPEADTNEICRT